MSVIPSGQNSQIAEKIILGSVQFGINYGINNAAGIPDDAELKAILDFAFEQGIKTIDCAEAYGNALDRIAGYHTETGNNFQIISKLKAVEDLDTTINKVSAILEKLGIPAFEAILLHDVTGYINNPALIRTLSRVKEIGLIRKIGVSIYTNQQFAIAVADDNVDIIQIPFNLLDNDSLRGDLMRQAKSNGKTIHVRSVFLQGLFFKSPETLPAVLKDLSGSLNQIAGIAADFELPVYTLALAYAMQNPLIDGVIIGVDSVNQLKENIRAGNTILSPECINRINSLRVPNPDLLNPSTWNA